MPGLLDIATSTQTVLVQGVDVPVFGVSAKGIAYLLEQFPDFRKVVTGNTADLNLDKIKELVPDAIAAIIAAGTGSPGDKAAEEIAAKLPAGDQADLLNKIFALTMPKGAGPFVEKLTGIAETVGGTPISIPGTKSPQQSNS